MGKNWNWKDVRGTAKGAVVGGAVGPVGTAVGAYQGSTGGGFVGGAVNPSNNDAPAGSGNPGDIPQPKFESARNSDGSLKSQYSVTTDPLLKDTSKYLVAGEREGYDAFKNRALQQGPSAWALLQQKQQNLEQQQGANQASRLASSGAAQARSSLGMRGGYSAGSQQALAKQAMKNRFQGLQANNLQGQQARLGIGIQDENTKNQFLQQLPQAELARNNFSQSQQQFLSGLDLANANGLRNAQQINATNALNDITNQNQAASSTYGQMMAARGAQATSDAINRPVEDNSFIGKVTKPVTSLWK